jgi:hypothetical protein
MFKDAVSSSRTKAPQTDNLGVVLTNSSRLLRMGSLAAGRFSQQRSLVLKPDRFDEDEVNP